MLTFEQANALLIYCALTGLIRWRVNVGRRGRAGTEAGHINPTSGYRQIRLDGRPYAAHRLAWLLMTGAWPTRWIQVDHINGVRDDNRATNLRLVTNADNCRNRHRARSDSGVLGVSWHNPLGKWRAHIKSDGKSRGLGYFDCKLETSMTYWWAKAKLHAIDSQTLADIIAARNCSVEQS